MEKTLSVIALVFAVSLAACQPKPENAPAPSPAIESPIQQTSNYEYCRSQSLSYDGNSCVPAPTSTAEATTAKPVKKAQSRSTTKQKTIAQAKTTTPRLDALEKRIRRIEDAAKQYGFNF